MGRGSGRRKKAGVPEGVTFRTKPEILALVDGGRIQARALRRVREL